MSKINKVYLPSSETQDPPEYIFRFPVGTEDPSEPVLAQVYFDQTRHRVRIFGNENKWGTFGIAWDEDNTNPTDKEK